MVNLLTSCISRRPLPTSSPASLRSRKVYCRIRENERTFTSDRHNKPVPLTARVSQHLSGVLPRGAQEMYPRGMSARPDPSGRYLPYLLALASVARIRSRTDIQRSRSLSTSIRC